MAYDNPLSNIEIDELLHDDVNIIDYSDFKSMNDINEAFEKSHNVVILYRWEPDSGHWCALIKHSENLIEFFDSFGGVPDHARRWNIQMRQASLGQDKPYLIMLLVKWMNEDKQHKLEYNHHIFQMKKYNTCGKWVCLRIWHNDMTLAQFIRKYKKLDDDDIIKIIKDKMKDDNKLY